MCCEFVQLEDSKTPPTSQPARQVLPAVYLHLTGLTLRPSHYIRLLMERYKSPTFCQMCDDHFSLFYLLIFRIYIIYKLSQSTALSLIAGKRRRIHVLYNLSINVRWKSDMRERATTVYWSWCKSLKLQLLVVPGPSPPPSPPSLSPACYWLKWQHWAGAAGRPVQSGVLDQLTIQVKFGKLSSLSSLLQAPAVAAAL